ncbi:class I SAM-dependent methyltransferase [Alicyclobacillus contaminans]|uniref:class I SAM-dependent methyltransferase n=1 Tax=Alicyclobacillus contaminans TaxID=392016 RepID=UPI000A03E229|nr:class I SAM-dependent methyltransferase [Alicyclobacillus contaminans]
MTLEQKRWNEKYSRRGPTLFPPEDFLVRRQHLLRAGTVLDVACGDGRHALYLARKGFAVTGIDFSANGLRLELFAAHEGVHVNTCQRDLDAEGILTDLGAFDNIVVIHFKPQLHTFEEMCRILRPNGFRFMARTAASRTDSNVDHLHRLFHCVGRPLRLLRYNCSVR